MKYIFCDIDGTIASKVKGIIPESCLKALKILKTKGHKIFICTGRNPASSNFALGIKLDGMINSAGAIAIMDDKVIYDKPYPSELFYEVMDFLDEHNGYASLECLKANYASERVYKLVQAFSENTRQTWSKTCDYAGEDVYKFMIDFDFRKDLDLFKETFKDKLNIHDNELLENYIEVCPKWASKGNAIKELIIRLNIDVNDCVVIGDDLNDISMFKLIPNSIAMGNAHPELKKYAKIISDDILADGFYQGFVRMGLIGEDDGK